MAGRRSGAVNDHGEGRCWGLFLAIAMACQFLGCSKQVYRVDTAGRFLEIRQVPADGRVGFGPLTRKTASGQRGLRRVHGDCEFVLEELLGDPRLIVETSNRRYYEVLCDPDDELAFEEVAQCMGLEVVNERRLVYAWILERTNDGSAELYPLDADKSANPYAARFARASIQREFRESTVYLRYEREDDTTYFYFDRVTIEEFIRYTEKLEPCLPVADHTGLAGRFAFRLSVDYMDRLKMDRPNILESTGLKLTLGKAELDMVVARDKEVGED